MRSVDILRLGPRGERDIALAELRRGARALFPLLDAHDVLIEVGRDKDQRFQRWFVGEYTDDKRTLPGPLRAKKIWGSGESPAAALRTAELNLIAGNPEETDDGEGDVLR